MEAKFQTVQEQSQSRLWAEKLTTRVIVRKQKENNHCEGSVIVVVSRLPPPGFELQSFRAGIFKISMGARHRVGIGLSYRPARLHRLAELMSLNRFLGSINV